RELGRENINSKIDTFTSTLPAAAIRAAFFARGEALERAAQESPQPQQHERQKRLLAKSNMADHHALRGGRRRALSCTAFRVSKEQAGPSLSKAFVLLCTLTASVVPSAGQQMDPAQMQRQIQQQMGGSPGGGGGGGAAPPNRI
ncbi:unnamed protein product, partial [Ectocarpus fasciculatus]